MPTPARCDESQSGQASLLAAKDLSGLDVSFSPEVHINSRVGPNRPVRPLNPEE